MRAAAISVILDSMFPVLRVAIAGGTLVLLTQACGPGAAPPAAEEMGEGEGGSTHASVDETGTTVATTVADASSTGEPPSECDARFDVGLPSGEVVWSRAITAPDSDEWQYANAVTVDPDGRVYAVGTLELAEDTSDGWVHALDADGTPRWELRYVGAAGFHDELTDVAIAASGTIVVVGTEETEYLSTGKVVLSEHVVVVLGYSPDGELLWRQELAAIDEHGLHQEWPDVATSFDGRIMVAATRELDGGWPQPFLAELAEDGTLVERVELSDHDYRGLAAADVQYDPAGVLFVVATAVPLGVGEDGEWLAVWDPARTLQSVSADAHRGAQAIAVLPRAEHGALVLGTIVEEEDGIPVHRPWLRRSDFTGRLQWAQRVDAGEDWLQPLALAGDCDGRALVLAANDQGSWIVTLDDEGNEVGRVMEMTAGTLRALATDPWGNPVLGGSERDEAGREAFVVRKLAR